MKRSLVAIMGIGVLALAGFLAYDRTVMAPIPLTAGTRIPLLLVTPLEAGQSSVGSKVSFIVSEDVVVNGKTIIKKGSQANGSITTSRGENALAALTNRPARLIVKLENVQSSNGVISLASDQKVTQSEYSFDRANTGMTAMQQKLDNLMSKPETRSLVEQLQKALKGESVPDLSNEDNKRALEAIAKELSLDNLSQALKEDTKGLQSVLDEVKTGKLIAGAASGDGAEMVFGALELLGSLDGLGRKFDHMLRGRTIRAYPGTQVTAYSKQTLSLRPL